MSNKIFIDIEKLIQATPVDESSDAPVSEKYGKFAWVWSPVLKTYVAYCIHRKDYGYYYDTKAQRVIDIPRSRYAEYKNERFFQSVRPYTFDSLDSILVGDKLTKAILDNVKLVPFITQDTERRRVFLTKAKGSTEIEINSLEDFSSPELGSSTYYACDLGMFVSNEPVVGDDVVSFRGKDIFFDKEYILELPRILDSFPVEAIMKFVPSGCKLKFVEQVNAYLPCDDQDRVVVYNVWISEYAGTTVHPKCAIRLNCNQLFMSAITYSMVKGMYATANEIYSDYAIRMRAHPEITCINGS